jgi:hypothetical protein
LNPGHTFTGPGFYGVPSGTPYLNGPIADTNFQFTSGTMTISNQLTGTLQWSGGNLAGALTIKPGGILNLRTPAVRGMTAAITNSGRINWQPNGPTLFSVQNSRIENLAGGVFDWQTDGVFTIANSPATFNNYGTLRKSGGTGTSGFPTGFNVNNVALFDVQSGTLQLPDLYQQFGGYLPVATNIFTVITYPSFSGGFTGTNLFALNFPNAWQTSYNPTSVTLTVINTSPILGLSVSGTNLTINWPGATDPSFVLQSTTNLSPPIPWVNVTNTVSASGNQNTVTIPILVPKLFLRMLSSPQ